MFSFFLPCHFHNGGQLLWFIILIKLLGYFIFINLSLILLAVTYT